MNEIVSRMNHNGNSIRIERNADVPCRFRYTRTEVDAALCAEADRLPRFRRDDLSLRLGKPEAVLSEVVQERPRVLQIHAEQLPADADISGGGRSSRRKSHSPTPDIILTGLTRNKKRQIRQNRNKRLSTLCCRAFHFDRSNLPRNNSLSVYLYLSVLSTNFFFSFHPCPLPTPVAANGFLPLGYEPIVFFICQVISLLDRSQGLSFPLIPH